jgi:mono/diheme cytochrome c family protein
VIFFLNLIILLVSLSACNKSGNETKISELEMHGKSIYLSQCIVCHNPNPNLAGSVGPDIANSSIELLTARIMKLEYPPQYKPKRQSKLMLALPHLEKDIPAIHAYLKTFKK